MEWTEYGIYPKTENCKVKGIVDIVSHETEKQIANFNL